MNGGNITLAMLFLALTFVFLLPARYKPRHHLYIVAAGIPLTLTIGPVPLVILAVAALVLGLALQAGEALVSWRDYLPLAGGVAFSLPFILLSSPAPDTIFPASLLLAAGVLFVALLTLLRLRFQIAMRGEAG
jgi:hypothetical protein